MPSAADSIQFSRHGQTWPWPGHHGPTPTHFFLLPQMKEQIMPNPKPGVPGGCHGKVQQVQHKEGGWEQE